MSRLRPPAIPTFTSVEEDGVNHRGDVVEGDWPVNRAAFCIHAAIHRARPDVTAAAHGHSVPGKAWSSLGRLLDPLTQDVSAF